MLKNEEEVAAAEEETAEGEATEESEKDGTEEQDERVASYRLAEEFEKDVGNRQTKHLGYGMMVGRVNDQQPNEAKDDLHKCLREKI